MNIIRLEDEHSDVFRTICGWNYLWWGQPAGKSMEQVEDFMRHCLCKGDRMPQTFVAMDGGVPVGMYQISVCDDLEVRPDIYPWLINVYVDETKRGKGICRFLMESVRENARKIGLKEIYLYTKHVGLYEKSGWEFVGEIDTFQNTPRIQRLYKMSVEATIG